jgi:hypothetical protein
MDRHEVPVDQQSPPSSVTPIYIVVSLAALAIFGVGLYLAISPPHSWVMLAAGCLSLVAVGISWPLAAAITSRAGQAASEQVASRLAERLEQVVTSLRVISEQQLLSDRAKSVAFRVKDRDAIRRAINEEMSHGEWEAAYALADQFEKAFGSKTEADRFRADITERRTEDVRKEIAEVAAVIDRHTRNEQWSAAMREAERLMQRFPDNEQVKNLPGEIEQRRQAHKKHLIQGWHEAVARQDNDASLDILKQLDPYLTPAEAESMQETVRQVFRERLNNLGAAFATAVREHHWSDAIRVGGQIQSEFPNSRIAQEVREKMDTLRQRAGEAPATATA